MDRKASAIKEDDEEQQKNLRRNRKLSTLEENFLKFVGGTGEKFEPTVDADDQSALSMGRQNS
jgi:hypothetical protein